MNDLHYEIHKLQWSATRIGIFKYQTWNKVIQSMLELLLYFKLQLSASSDYKTVTDITNVANDDTVNNTTSLDIHLILFSKAVNLLRYIFQIYSETFLKI